MPESTPLVARFEAPGDNTLNTVDRVTLAYIAESDTPPTRYEIRDALNISADKPIQRFREYGLLDRDTRVTGTDGRDPYCYSLSNKAQAAVNNDSPEWTRSALRKRVIREMASLHYGRRLSSVTTFRVAELIPGASQSQVGVVFANLCDDGVVECVQRGSTNRYRLVGVGLFEPFRAMSTPKAVFADD